MQFEKKNTTATIKAENFPSEIRSISTGPSNLCTVTVTSSNTTQGTVSGGGSCTSGMRVELTSTAKSGYKIKDWKEGSTTVGTTPSIIIPVTTNRSLQANFQSQSNWSQASGISSNYWEIVASNGNTFTVFTYNTPVALYSSDGVNYEQFESSSRSYVAAATGLGKSVVFTTTRVLYSDDCRVYAWGSVEVPGGSGTWADVCFGNNIFLAIADHVNAIARSTDGINWTVIRNQLPSISNNYWRSVAGGQGRFIVVTPHVTNKAAYSTDNGSTWTSFTILNSTWNCIIFGNGKWIVGGSNKIGYSTDGINWTLVSNPPEGYWFWGIYGDNKFILMSRDNASGGYQRLVYSLDGINWKSNNLPAKLPWEGRAYANGKFVICSGQAYGYHQLSDTIVYLESKYLT